MIGVLSATAILLLIFPEFQILTLDLKNADPLPRKDGDDPQTSQMLWCCSKCYYSRAHSFMRGASLVA